VANLQRDLAADPAPVIFGYSQGADVGTRYTRIFNQHYGGDASGTTSHPTWVFIGNPNRPNDGFFERFSGVTLPIVDTAFDGATSTHTAGAVASG
jgi:hypothetical protein